MIFWIVLSLLLILLMAMVLGIWFNRHGNRKRTVVIALIDIYTTGSHHIEFIPGESIHPVDMVQLAVSYLANVIMLSASRETEFTIGLDALVNLVYANQESGDETTFRNELAILANSPLPSLLSSGKLSAGNSERYQVRLIRGKNIDYTISDFSAYGYKPNLTNSALYLYHFVVERLDSSHIKLLNGSLIGLVNYSHHKKLTVGNNQLLAFSIVEYVLKVLSDQIETCPGRVSRKMIS